MDPAPVENNVRYAPNSDHSRHEPELTLCASSGHRAPSFKRKRPPTEAAYLNFTNSISVVSHTGHSKVRMSRVGPSASMQASHISVPHMRHNGRSMVTECEGTIWCCAMAFPLLQVGTQLVSQSPIP